MVDWSRLLLASAATVIHGVLLAAAPLAAEVAGSTERLLSARTPARLGVKWRSLLARLQPADDRVPVQVLAGFGCSFAAFMLVPSFATGMLTAPMADLPLVAFLLAGGRLAMLASGSDPVTMGRGLGIVVLSVPALLLASLAVALFSRTTGLDAAIVSAATAPSVPLGLAVLALALVAVADLDGLIIADGAGPMPAVITATAQVRLLLWLDLVAAFLPPWSTTAATAGPLAWLAALLLWPVKVGLLAAALGIVRFSLGSVRASWRFASLRVASLLALLSGVFILIGQTLE